MMLRKMAFWSLATLLMGAIGCASMMAADKERQLSAAGFQMKMADTAAQTTHLAGLQQLELFATERQGRTVWIYADAKNCKCMYVGSDIDYQRYQRNAMVKREVDEERDAAEDMDSESMEWGTWGEFYRPIY